jgi:hypothetical protein
MIAQLLVLARLVVVCDPADSLRPVAEEIAGEESIAVADSWSEVHGEYLVWVVEPGRLSDRVLVSFARAWRDRFPETAVGLIVGRTPEQARALWRRARDVRAMPSAAFDARNPISKERFVEVLSAGGYVTFAGHGGETYLRLGSDGILKSNELPPVPNLVIGTESCNVFRPWARDSIALALVENGAAAFAGFAYSPESGFLIGGYDGLPFRYTSPEFPIGRVVQLQNRGAMRAFAALPIYFLLGDPRMALTAQPPYRITADESRDGSRQITLAGAPPGLLPVRIRGASGYDVIEACGTSAARGHGFYNSRLQALDAGSDKFVLVDCTGGPLILRLHRAMPWWWPAKTLFLEALDNALVFFGSGSPACVLALVLGLLVLLAVACRGATRRAIVGGAVAGAVLAALHLVWVLARLGHITVISKSTSLNPLAMVATFVLTGSAGVLYMAAGSRRGRAIALLLATFPAWAPAVLHLAFTLGANLAVFQPHVGASVYSHRMAQLAACSSAITFVAVLCVFALVRRRFAQSAMATAEHGPD